MGFFLAILGLFAAPQSTLASPTAKQMVEKVQRYYDATRDLHAKFSQELSSAIGGPPRKASGEVWLKKPGKMRWDYQKPEDDRKVMIADGSSLWVYEAEDAQAFKTPLRSSTLPAQVSFLLGEGKLTNDFDAEIVHPPGIGQPGQVVLKMVPKTGTAAYRYLLFVVDPKSGQVVETVIYDQQGGTNTLRFSDLEQNRKIDDAKFKFTPPRGVKVVSPP